MRLIDWINLATVIIVLNKKLIAFINIILVHIAHENTCGLLWKPILYIFCIICVRCYTIIALIKYEQ